MRKSQVLIVDEDAAIISRLKSIITADGHDAADCKTSAEALKLLASSVYDLLIVEKELPDGSGLTLIESARKLGYRGETILITGYSDTESAIQAITLGVFCYEKKPLNLEKLRVDITRALETGILRRSLSGRTRDLEKANQELTAALERAKHAESQRVRAERMATIGYLAAAVAHEINNPLSMLSMTIPYAVGELTNIVNTNIITLDPETASVSLERMLKNLEHTQEALEFLIGLSADLRSLGREESGEAKRINLSEAVGASLRLVGHDITAKAVVETDIPDDLAVQGWKNRLIQVFINLLTNASKATSHGRHPDKRISIVARRLGDVAQIVVRDNGVGIAPEDIGRIFDRFYTHDHGEPQPEGQDRGSGIGLALVKELVDDHAGTISVESTLGEGSTFTITLPAPPLGKISVVPAVAHPASRPPEKRARTILFLDESDDNLQSYDDAFSQIQEVHLANNPAAALALIDEIYRDLDVIICELKEPGHPWQTLYENIRDKYPEFSDRFVFIGELGPMARQAEQDGHKVILKPIRTAELLAHIYQISPRSPSKV